MHFRAPNFSFLRAIACSRPAGPGTRNESRPIV